MKVLEAIQHNNHFVITNSNGILAINNGEGISLGLRPKASIVELFSMEVLKVEYSKRLLPDCHTNIDLIRV